MKWLRALRDTPKWVIMATVTILIVMVYLGIVRNIVWFTAGTKFGRSGIQYPTAYHLSSSLPITMRTNIIYIAGIVICLLMGVVCLLLGVARSMNRLDGTSSYLMAAFLTLFSINTFSAIDFITVPFQPVTLFFIHWGTYYIYTFPFFLYVLHILRPSLQKWTWPFFILPATYSVAAWVAYLTTGLPFEMHDQLYTLFAECGFIILMVVAFFGAEPRGALWHIRIISMYWNLWFASLLIRLLFNTPLRIHEEAIINIVISAILSVGYLVLSGTKELFTYKSSAQMLKVSNELLLESFDRIESYSDQIALMKHEMNHHLFAIKILLADREYDKLAGYLSDISETYYESLEPFFCGHRLIQSILGQANYRAHQSGIAIRFDIMELPPMSIKDTDTVELLMNLLDNALESCEKIQPVERRWIAVSIKRDDTPYLHISVKNAVLNHAVKREHGVFISSKNEDVFHGHGIAVVQGIVKKYNGFIDFNHTEDSFAAVAALRVVVV